MDYILRGRAASYKPTSRDNFDETVSLFERALALDPRSSEAQSYLAIEPTARVLEDMTDTAAADLARVEGLAGKALAVSPRSGLAHFAKGQALRAQCRYAEAIPEYEIALALNRYLMGAYAPLGWRKFHTGSIDEVITLAEQAIRLVPAILWSVVGILRPGRCIYCSRAPAKRSRGSRRRAAPIRYARLFTLTSPPPMPSQARLNTRSPSSPKLEG